MKPHAFYSASIITFSKLVEILCAEFPNTHFKYEITSSNTDGIHAGWISFNGIIMEYIENEYDRNGSSYFTMRTDDKKAEDIYSKIGQYTGGSILFNECIMPFKSQFKEIVKTK